MNGISRVAYDDTTLDFLAGDFTIEFWLYFDDFIEAPGSGNDTIIFWKQESSIGDRHEFVYEVGSGFITFKMRIKSGSNDDFCFFRRAHFGL